MGKQRVRQVVGVLCLIAASCGLLWPLVRDFIAGLPVHYASAHPASTVPPIMSFAEDSVFNVGSAEELDQFPNIGVVLSNRMVEYRELWGPYRIPDDLAQVKGIGAKTVAGIMEVLEEPLVPMITPQPVHWKRN